MIDLSWAAMEGKRTLERLLPNLEPLFDDPEQFQIFQARLDAHFPKALAHLHRVYGNQYDFFWHLDQILHTVAKMFLARPLDLHELDFQREANPLWFQEESMVGGVCYVDLFAGDLNGIREKIPYFKELGLSYLHLMPLFDAPENSDGGYAISDFRKVRPDLGTMEDLAKLSAELRQDGISLVLDFVFNHTSDEHEWAIRARAGEEKYQRFYFFFPDRTMPDQYEPTLREIFPEQAPGNFTYNEEVQAWVWTTFNTFQWDLNYANPDVFNAMLGELLFLANQGVEIMRFDAVVFIWKRLGTPCENEPEVHHLIRAFNALTRIAAPAMLFKSEAIVHPDDVASFIHPDECQLSYNPTMMALLWEALATREVKLLRHSMTKRFDIPNGTSWINYVRVHDDIGWSFANEDAQELWINGFDHRQFLNRFYMGEFDGSFATGLPFNFNPITLDTRICGTCASLAGLEQAIQIKDKRLIDLALHRIILIYSVAIAAGGIPLIYLNDEIATINDYSYRADPNKRDDSRWVHRPEFDWERAKLRNDPASPQGKVFTAFKRMLFIRRNDSAFSDKQTVFFDTLNPHVLGFIRNAEVLVLANFSDFPQSLETKVLEAYWNLPEQPIDLYSGDPIQWGASLTIEPFSFLWLT